MRVSFMSILHSAYLLEARSKWWLLSIGRRRSYCSVSSCLMVAPLPSPFSLLFILLLLLG
jgi:hypothetical protein